MLSEQADSPPAPIAFALKEVTASVGTVTSIPVPVNSATVPVWVAVPLQVAFSKILIWVAEPEPTVPTTLGLFWLEGLEGWVPVIVGAPGAGGNGVPFSVTSFNAGVTDASLELST